MTGCTTDRNESGKGSTKVKIYLFRHGETAWNKERKLQGQSDVPLNEYGRELAMKTAGALQEIPFDRVFASPLSRAAETARILMGERDIPFRTDRRLMEMHFGQYEGDAFDPPKTDPAHPLYPFLCRPEDYIAARDAESFEEVTERGMDFLQEQILPLEGSCENILIVAHGAFNRCLLNGIANIPRKDFWKTALPNCAASILSLENGRFRILEESRIYY